MVLVIDASNIRAGGGVTHLIEILNSEEAAASGFNKIYVWAPDETLEKIQNKDWIEKCGHPWINTTYYNRVKWKYKILEPFVKEQKALLFIPGTGSSSQSFVTMCQNLLPLDLKELNRYFPSKDWVRLKILRFLHLKAYKEAKGVIFLNYYSKSVLPEKVSKEIKQYRVIAHGLNKRFYNVKKNPTEVGFSESRPLKLIYVSIVDIYKHQWQLAEAVFQLEKEGYYIHLDLIGPSYAPALKKLEVVLEKYSSLTSVKYHGSKVYEQIHEHYQEADAFIFASTCETYGMVITEAMAAGLPIICSDHSSMPETVKDAAIYFNPLDVNSIKAIILQVYHDSDLRIKLSSDALEMAKTLSWETSAKQTFKFLADISRELCVE